MKRTHPRSLKQCERRRSETRWLSRSTSQTGLRKLFPGRSLPAGICRPWGSSKNSRLRTSPTGGVPCFRCFLSRGPGRPRGIHGQAQELGSGHPGDEGTWNQGNGPLKGPSKPGQMVRQPRQIWGNNAEKGAAGARMCSNPAEEDPDTSGSM